MFRRIRSRSKNVGKPKIDAGIRAILDHAIVLSDARLRGVLAGQTGGRQSQRTLDVMRAGVKIPGVTPCEPEEDFPVDRRRLDNSSLSEINASST